MSSTVKGKHKKTKIFHQFFNPIINPLLPPLFNIFFTSIINLFASYINRIWDNESTVFSSYPSSEQISEALTYKAIADNILYFHQLVTVLLFQRNSNVVETLIFCIGKLSTFLHSARFLMLLEFHCSPYIASLWFAHRFTVTEFCSTPTDELRWDFQ